jgi:hypothetical protein
MLVKKIKIQYREKCTSKRSRDNENKMLGMRYLNQEQ